MNKLGLMIVVSVVLSLSFFLMPGNTQMGGGMMGGSTGPGQSGDNQPAPENPRGPEVFDQNCSRCHPQGGNNIIPNLPLKGSPQLANFRFFLSFIRHPTMPDGSPGPMPPFSEAQISEEQARELYHYLVRGESTTGPGPGRGYGMGPGMMGRGWGHGMGPGMMGPGMGPGMMGPGYGYQQPYPPPQQPRGPLDEKEAKELVENYVKSTRNPNLKLGKVTDHGPYFEADVVTKNNSLVDKIVVNKDTGEMRSRY